MLHLNNFLQEKYSFSIFLTPIPFIVSKRMKQTPQSLFHISDLYLIENAIKYKKLLSEIYNANWPLSIVKFYLEKLLMFMCLNSLRGTFTHGDSCISDIHSWDVLNELTHFRMTHVCSWVLLVGILEFLVVQFHPDLHTSRRTHGTEFFHILHQLYTLDDIHPTVLVFF